MFVHKSHTIVDHTKCARVLSEQLRATDGGKPQRTAQGHQCARRSTRNTNTNTNKNKKIKGKPNNCTRSPQVLKKPADLMEHKRTKKEQAHFFMFNTSGSISEGVRKMGNWLDSQWLLYPRCLAAGTIASRAICCCLQMKTSSFCQHA